jgi:hypothetical protein
VSRYGEDVFKKYDRQTYEQKLELLDCKDQNILESAARFRRTRIELVHEKAYQDDGEIRRAQDEAENAHALLTAVHNHFLERPNRNAGQQIQ